MIVADDLMIQGARASAALIFYPVPLEDPSFSITRVKPSQASPILAKPEIYIM